MTNCAFVVPRGFATLLLDTLLSLLSTKSLPDHVTATVARHVTEGQEHCPLRWVRRCFPACSGWLVVGVGTPSEASWSPQMWAVSRARCRAAHLEQVQVLAAPGLK